MLHMKLSDVLDLLQSNLLAGGIDETGSVING